MAEGELSELVVIEGWMEAEIIKQRLESFSIPVLLQYESAGRIFGITMNGLGKVRIMVPPDHLAEARQLLVQEPENEETAAAT